MKSVRPWLKLIAVATSFCLTHTMAIANANTTTRLEHNLDSIDIFVPPPEQDSPDICSAYIEPIINRIVERPLINRGKWAILVQSLDGTTIYSRHPDSYMIPASNVKLLVTAAALQRLNPSSTIYSQSIREWITVTNLSSNNYYANALLNFLGGSHSVQQALTSLGVDTNGYRLRDGSGLSRNNLITPRTLVSTLRAMNNAKGKDVFFASLPVAGVSGTLRNRLRDTAVQGTVHAKTGTLKGVRALSGYMEHPEYGTLIFSIITNQPNYDADDTVVKTIDEIVLHLSNLKSCQ